MTVSALSTDHSFQSDAFTNLLTSLSLLFRGLGNREINTVKSEDDTTALQLKTKYEFHENDPPPPYPFNTITEPQNVREKIKQDKAIAHLLSEEVMVPEKNTQIDPLFIDDNDVLAKDDLTDENKEFIKTLLDRSNYFFDDDDKQQDLIQTDLTNTDLIGETNTD